MIDEDLRLHPINVYMDKQITDTGAVCITVMDLDGNILCVSWQRNGKPIRRRGGTKSYVKLQPDQVLGLSDTLLLAVVKLSPYIKVNGLLTDKARRRRLTKERVMAVWDFGKNKSLRVWNELVDKEVLFLQEEGVFVNRNYISRG